ncbi:exonuclease V [Hypoxylon trugodes]|uniref:exonuclease V n=1 Tax=Hypoxylon trugodes TaxID=326681 RepID=UPI0021A01AC9|nr:exonuclease V [Hypoxylon trugodes]KAI1382707.1 exonuclease V [Hypoxylon trugodes]
MATFISPILGRDGSPESDYGSDFSLGEEGIVNQLLEDLGNSTASPSQSTSTDTSYTQFVLPADVATKVASGLSNPSLFFGKEHRHRVLDSHSPPENAPQREVKTSASNRTEYHDDPTTHPTALAQPSAALDDVQYPDLSRVLPDTNTITIPELASSEPTKDSRSPLQRLRSFPKKPLTVSDLASGAWCELQYWYTLTRLPGGKKTKTAAMRGGSRVHQALEDQVHTAIQVSVSSKEEAFALRLWNLIQGLRTLRDTGMTRELEVWGIIEGQIVNGIVDELSHESPNAAFEQELHLSQSSEESTTVDPRQQATITDYLEHQHKKVYLTDVKTRGSERLPTGAALRPARVQLFLYHRLLGEMAAGLVDFTVILDRYGLRADALFSDGFMAQVGDLHDEIFYDADSDLGTTGGSDSAGQTASSSTPPPDLIKYRSIAQILPLLQSELLETFPQGTATLGDLLAVQYRHRDDGRILGNNSFPNDPEALDGYVRRYLEWWRGEREADGVTIEETYKCRSCEFAESCQWRKDKEDEFLQKKRNTRVRK